MSDPYLNRPEPPRRPPDLEREPVQIDTLLWRDPNAAMAIAESFAER